MKKEAYKKNLKKIINTMTFMEALHKGLVDENDFEEFINEWHNNQKGKNIAEFLGMAEQEYFAFLKKHISSLNLF